LGDGVAMCRGRYGSVGERYGEEGIQVRVSFFAHVFLPSLSLSLSMGSRFMKLGNGRFLLHMCWVLEEKEIRQEGRDVEVQK
jgi:hypothetical protein